MCERNTGPLIMPCALVKYQLSLSNKCADRLARLGTETEENFVVFEAPPSVITPLLFLDKLGTTQDRICNEMVLAT